MIAELPEQAISGPIASAQETWYEYYFNPYSQNYEYVEANAATPRDPSSGALSKEYLDKVFKRIPNNPIFQKEPTRAPLEPPVEQTSESSTAASLLAAADSAPVIAAAAGALIASAAAMSALSGPKQDQKAVQPTPAPVPQTPGGPTTTIPNEPTVISSPGNTPINSAVDQNHLVQQISQGVLNQSPLVVLRPVYNQTNYRKRRKKKRRVAPKTGIPRLIKNSFNFN